MIVWYPAHVTTESDALPNLDETARDMTRRAEQGHASRTIENTPRTERDSLIRYNDVTKAYLNARSHRRVPRRQAVAFGPETEPAPPLGLVQVWYVPATYPHYWRLPLKEESKCFKIAGHNKVLVNKMRSLALPRRFYITRCS